MGTLPRADRATLDGAWWMLPIALPAFAALLAPIRTIDLAYHVRLGEMILRTGSVPARDTFTFSVPDAEWVDQQWLAQVLFEIAHRAGSWSGLAVLGAVLLGIAGGLTAATCRARGASIRAAGALALGGFVVAAPMLGVRPQLLAVPLFTLALWGVWTRRDHPSRLWLLPVIGLVLANLHGSFPLIVVMSLLAAAEDVAGRGALAVRSVVVAGVTILATLLNPAGLGAWRYVADITRNPIIRDQVTEWSPLSLGRAPGLLVALSVVAVAIIGARSRSRVRSVDLVWLTLFLVTAISSERAAVWWAFTAPVIVAGWVTVDRAAPRSRPSQRVPVALAAGLLVLVLPWWRGGPELHDAPPGVTDALASLPAGTAVFVHQPWASWVEHATPGLTVYVDSRIELFPAGIWARYDEIAAGGAGAIETLETTGAKAVAGEPSMPLIERLRLEPGWEIVYDGPDGVVVVRT